MNVFRNASALLLCLSAASSAAAGVNPVLDMFPRDVTFHLNFDDGTVDPAVGLTKMRGAAFDGAAFEDALYVSVNGAPWSKAMCTPLVAMLRPLWVQVNGVYGPKNRSTDGLVALDEITIFSKRLSETELRLLYERTCKEAGQTK